MVGSTFVRRALTLAATAAVLGVLTVPAAAQETGRIQGSVVNATTQSPLQGAQVFLPGTNLGTLTDSRGRFMLLNVPAGQHELQVQMIGYAEGSQTVSVAGGETAVVSFELQATAIELGEIVVTGVAGETQRAKLPFTVDKLDTEQMPVPTVSVTGMLKSKMPGVSIISGSGQPGDDASIQLRGATSIDAEDRTQAPLIIVDGAILGEGESLADLGGLDVESMEVVKGAAAASLYGSRAANGVIQITTKRGRSLSTDGLRFTARSEYGISQLGDGRIALAQYHPYALTSDGTAFADTLGNATEFVDAILAGTGPERTFQDNVYPGETYDHLDRFFDPGDYMDNFVAVDGRFGSTNFRASYNNVREQGVVMGHDGFKRQNFRLNLDHGIREDLRLSVSSFYSLSDQDDVGTNPFFSLTFMAPTADLLAEDADGSLIINPDPRSLEANPIYEVLNRDERIKRNRVLGSILLDYAPTSWFRLEGNLSYDRAEQKFSDLRPKGYKTVTPSAVNAGRLDHRNRFTQAINASVTSSVTRTFGDLNTRLQGRWLVEMQDYEFLRGQGDNFAVEGVPSLTATTESYLIRSEDQKVRAEGYYLIGGLDYRDRYIADVLVRRDGSSLFGPEERWATYYRASGAWRVSEEDWWVAEDVLNEFKLRYSYGTAGGRPNFWAQYETYDIEQGRVVPNTLGNKELKPEFAREHEAGIDFTAFNRVNASLTYANSIVEDQLLEVPLPGYAGFTQQWRNAGTLESDTWEASLNATVLARGDMNWSASLGFDRTRQEITQLDVPPYRVPFASEYYIREGEVLGTFYGTRFATSCAELPTEVQASCGSDFTVNDDGYLVYVGSGNGYQDGPGADGQVETGDDLWGTTGEVAGNSYGWGMPITAVDADGNSFLRLGNSQPDYSVNFSNTFDWRGLSAYLLFDATIGPDIYNQTAQWAYREQRHASFDQVGKAEGLKKPIAYYSTLYNVNATSSHFVEDGSFVKFREASLRYTLSPDQIAGLGLDGSIEGITLSLIGRNLKTWTDYTGYDPEVGFGAGGNSEFGSAVIERSDAYQYPNFRTFTGAVEVVF